MNTQRSTALQCMCKHIATAPASFRSRTKASVDTGAAVDSIQIFVPLTIRKKNGRPKIMPPANCLPSEDQTQDPPYPALYRSGLGLAAALGSR